MQERAKECVASEVEVTYTCDWQCFVAFVLFFVKDSK